MDKQLYNDLITKRDHEGLKQFMEERHRRITEKKKEKILNLETRAVLEKLERENAHLKVNPIQKENHLVVKIIDTNLDVVE
jgi:hypothetical protein